MSETAQDRALRTYRKRLRQRGLARFEVLALDADRKLIRSFAKHLAENGPAAKHLRLTVSRTLSEGVSKKGAIFAALRRSPLVGSSVEFKREVTGGRKVDL